MGKPTFKPVIKVRYKADAVGIVNIRRSHEGKHTFTSLKIHVPVKHWNIKAGAVRKSLEGYEDLNQQIKERLEEIMLYDSTPAKPTGVSKHSFTSYFDSFINRFNNAGSKIKYIQVLKKVKAYLKEKGKTDLLFHEINSDLIYDFRNYTLKNCSVNTTTHYLKLIKQVINSAIELNHYNYIRHPYLGVDFKKTKVNKSALSEAEISKILNTYISESDFLFDTRNCFVTQIFLQGMRVSDLLLLRYSHIKGDSIDFNMFKTANPMRVYIPDLVWTIFIHQFKKAVRRNAVELTTINRLEAELDKLKEQAIEYLRTEENILSGFELIINDRTKELDETDAPIFNQIRIQKLQIFESYKGAIKIFASSYPNEFIFDFLQDEDFSNIRNNDFSKLTEYQYKRMKNKTIVYNRHLKLLQLRVGLTTTLKSHLSRSSYASMLLNNDVDVYAISAALGHSGLNITEKYLSGFNTKKVAEINKNLADRFTS